MNKQSITAVVKKLYKELPQLGFVCISESLWFAREEGWKSHVNSNTRVSVFSKNNRLLDGFNLPIDTTPEEIGNRIKEVIHKAFPTEAIVG